MSITKAFATFFWFDTFLFLHSLYQIELETAFVKISHLIRTLYLFLHQNDIPHPDCITMNWILIGLNCFDMTFVVIWHFIWKKKLNWTEFNKNIVGGNILNMMIITIFKVWGLKIWNDFLSISNLQVIFHNFIWTRSAVKYLDYIHQHYRLNLEKKWKLEQNRKVQHAQQCAVRCRMWESGIKVWKTVNGIILEYFINNFSSISYFIRGLSNSIHI